MRAIPHPVAPEYKTSLRRGHRGDDCEIDEEE